MSDAAHERLNRERTATESQPQDVAVAVCSSLYGEQGENSSFDRESKRIF